MSERRSNQGHRDGKEGREAGESGRADAVSLDELRAARLDWVMIIDVDALTTRILRPDAYLSYASAFLKRLGALHESVVHGDDGQGHEEHEEG